MGEVGHHALVVWDGCLKGRRKEEEAKEGWEKKAGLVQGASPSPAGPQPPRAPGPAFTVLVFLS